MKTGVKYGRGKAAAATIEAVRSAGTGGMTYEAVGKRCGISMAAARSALQPSRRAGVIVVSPKSGRLPSLVYLAEFAPPPPEAKAAPPKERVKANKVREARQVVRAASLPSKSWAAAEAIVPPNVRRVVGPSNLDQRHTVRRLPEGYVSQINPAECREWAKAAR